MSLNPFLDLFDVLVGVLKLLSRGLLAARHDPFLRSRVWPWNGDAPAPMLDTLGLELAKAEIETEIEV